MSTVARRVMDMTIDEAIEHAIEVSEIQRNNDKLNKTLGVISPYYKTDCIKCAEEHEQLAEWLEELKMYREAERTLDNAYNNGYNKAIDDFSNEIDKYIERYDGTIYDEAYYTNVKSDFEDLKKIGNQLKAGV